MTSDDLVIRALDYQSKCPYFKTARLFQGRLGLASFKV